jgi:hypothetical protein
MGPFVLDPRAAPVTSALSFLGGILLASSAGFKYRLCPFSSGILSLYLHLLAMLLTSMVQSVSGETSVHFCTLCMSQAGTSDQSERVGLPCLLLYDRGS